MKKKYHELEIIEIIDIENKLEFSCYDEFCDIWDMANMFGRYNKLYNMDIALTDEFIEYVKKLNNEEINNIEDAEKMLENEIKFIEEANNFIRKSDELSKYLINQTGNKPMIITVMQEI